jgi:RNA methyltransferase, TrmH family
MVSKNQIKLINSLNQKKFRKLNQSFLAEGAKVINELLESSYELVHLYSTNPMFDLVSDAKKTVISFDDLNKISQLSTANDCLAIFKIPSEKKIDCSGLVVALDDIRDPGNLGTIIRLCDWFGVSQIVCSLETADVFNPKVVQATMGSITRVNVTYVDLEIFLQNQKTEILGTFMSGESVYKNTIPQNSILVLGNEANGISKQIEKLVTQKISIPRFGDLQQTESLNVASACAIFLSEFKRN